jgi:hypothetical protein
VRLQNMVWEIPEHLHNAKWIIVCCYKCKQNGIEPRSLITTKLNKTGGIKMVVRSNHHWINILSLDIKDNSGINKW